MVQVLLEEFQNADIPFGCNGQLPISNFQTIMIDYDLPLMEFDMKEMRTKSVVVTDKQGNEFIKYKELMEIVKPNQRQKNDIKHINYLVTKVQSAWRGY